MRKSILRNVPVAFLILSLLASVTVLNSCTFNNFEELKEKYHEENPNAFCDSAQVTFSGDVIKILERNCANASFDPGSFGCHQAGSQIADYTIYAGVKAKVDEGKLEQRALVEKSMPPPYSVGPRPDSIERRIIQCWINAGAPNN